MLSNFSWLQYGVFMGVSLLIYYLLLIVLYYRKEVRGLWGSLTKAKIRGSVLAKDRLELDGGVDGGLMGRAVAEEGMTCLGMDELDFGGEEGNGEMLQGQLADCMEELKYAFLEAEEAGWDRKKLGCSLFEIANCYAEVFASPLGHQLWEHICSELRSRFDWNISVLELDALLTKKERGAGLAAGCIAVLAFLAQLVHAQDGNQGIAEATSKVAGYFDTGTDLMYAIGAIMGLVGAVKVYSKWNAGEPDTAKVATAWFGSCIFLVVVATVLKSFFGI